MTSKTTNKVLPEVRARAVRMVLDHKAEHPPRRATIMSISGSYPMPAIGADCMLTDSWAGPCDP